MQYLNTEQLICVDVDDSIILWNTDRIKDNFFKNPFTGQKHSVAIHKPHVRVIKQRLARGATVILWSASGPAWAKAAAFMCDIKGDNLIIAPKPIFHLDDKPAENWMGPRMYMDPDDQWGL